MKNCLKTLEVVHFADDSTLYSKYNSSSFSNIINSDLANLNIWLAANKLILNVNKTKYMTFRNRRDPPQLQLKINNRSLQYTNTHKFLGLYIDENLNFKTHINKISSKIASGLGMIRKISHFVPSNILIQLHYAFIHSKFTYALSAYGSVSHVQKIEKLVNRSLKLCTGVSTLTTDLYRRKKLFNFSTAHKYFCCIKMYQIIKLNMHQFFSHKISRSQVENSRITRQNILQNMRLPLMRSNKCQNSFIYVGTKFWNELPLAVKDASNIKEFKYKLKIFYFT